MAQASEFELAHVVLAYLETKGWHKTATSFQRCVFKVTPGPQLPACIARRSPPAPPTCREAKTLLKSGRRPQGQAVRVLDDLVNGYLQLAAREAQRATLAQLNPLAGQMLSLLDISAALPPLSMPHLQQQQQPVELMRGSGGAAAAGAAAAAAVAAAAAAAGGAMVPMAAVGGGGQPLLDPLQPPQQPSQQPRPATTPGRHAQRKGAPQRKRRRLDADFEAARPLMPTSPPDFPYNEHSLLGDVPFGDLLYRAVDPAGVMQVLDHEDEALNKFSTLLADNINRTALGGDHFPDGECVCRPRQTQRCPFSNVSIFFWPLQPPTCCSRTCCRTQRRRRS